MNISEVNGVKVRISETYVSVSRGNLPYKWGKEENQHWQNFRDLLRFMGSMGFYVGEDKEIKRKYPALSSNHRIGRYGDLKFKAEWAQNYFSIKFYQDINYENPYGGYYDFDQIAKMPYLIRKQFELSLKKMIRYFESKGYLVEQYSDGELKGSAFIVDAYIRSCHHPQKKKFDLSEIDGMTEDSYNSHDRDNKIIFNGEEKYFRDWNGYLYRGKVYHNINNMWWVLLPSGKVRNKASFELFDLCEDDCIGRQKQHTPPEGYVERKRQLSLCSTKELENELRRRKKAEITK